jgi:hypothetical protein
LLLPGIERCTGRKKEAGIGRDNGTTTDRQTNEFDDKPAEKKRVKCRKERGDHHRRRELKRKKKSNRL